MESYSMLVRVALRVDVSLRCSDIPCAGGTCSALRNCCLGMKKHKCLLTIPVWKGCQLVVQLPLVIFQAEMQGPCWDIFWHDCCDRETKAMPQTHALLFSSYKLFYPTVSFSLLENTCPHKQAWGENWLRWHVEMDTPSITIHLCLYYSLSLAFLKLWHSKWRYYHCRIFTCSNLNWTHIWHV